MSSAVEDEIVKMSFDNTQFEKAATTSLSTLEKLKQSLTFSKTGSSSELSNIANQIKGFSTNPMVNGAAEVGRAFSAMSVVAISAIATVASQVTNAGINMAKSLSVAPITAGLHEYETNLNSIQTVLANTGLEGQKGLDTVNSALNQLNTYSDKTIYNFSEMARNIGTFTAAGVDLDTSVAAIKGIANLAAVSGSSSQQASTAMYQLSQALSSGTVRLMDWNSVVNAGMGGKVFQENLKETARVHGVAVDDIIKEQGSFRDSLQEGWLTSDILNESLMKMTGDLNESQLKSMGYNDEQIAGIIKMGKTAQDAATKVKTMSQLFGTLQEAAGSGWARTWQMVFGDFNEAKGLFTGINNVVGGAITASAKARNKVLGHWKELGGRDLLLSGLAKAADSVMDVISPISKAFRDIFPRQTGHDLLELTQRFHDFAETLSLNETTMDNIRRTARGFFAVLDIGWQIIKGLFGIVGDLFGAMGDGSGEFLNFTGNIGDLLVALDNWLKSGDRLSSFFDNIGGILGAILAPLGAVAHAFFSLFDGLTPDKAQAGLDGIAQKLSPIQSVLKAVAAAWDWLMGKMAGAGALLQPVFDAFGHIGDALAGAISADGVSGLLDIVNTALLGGLTVIIAKFLGNITNSFQGVGIMSNISQMFGELSDTLSAFQTNLQAGTLMKIAIAVGVLTASIVALSLINAGDLTKALTAVSVGFAQLLIAFNILSTISTTAGFIKMPLLAASMIMLAGAILLLSGAVAIMAQLSWNELLKGLTGVTVLLVGLSLAANLMSGASGPMLRAGIAMIPLAIGLNLLAVAMKIFATMSWEEMAKGLVGLAGGLLIIAGAMQLMPVSMPLTAAGLLLVGIALGEIAGAMMLFATMGWEEMAKGMVGIAGGLLIIAGAMQLMPISLPITAAGLILVASALAGIAGVAKIFATMSWEEMGKAAAGLAGALLIISGGLYLMSGTLAGSAALLVAAAALAILVPVLIALGDMTWQEIVTGLLALAGAFTVLGLAGLILTPLVPSLLGLGLALALVGIGMALAGAGALAFATAFSIFTAAGVAGTMIIAGLIALIPGFATALGQAVINFATVIAENGSQLVDAWVKLLNALITGAIKIIPKVGQLFTTLVLTGLKVIRSLFPAILQTGIELILAFIRGVTARMGEMTDAAGDLIVAFIRGVAKQTRKIAQAAADAILDFLHGISAAIDANSREFGEAGADIALSISKGLISAIAGYAGQIGGAIRDMIKAAAKNVDVGSIIDAVVPGRRSPIVELTGNFAKLVGGTDQVKTALSTIGDEIHATLDKAGGDIDKWKKRLNELNHAKVKDPKAIQHAQKMLKDAKQLRNAAEDANKAYKNQMKTRADDLRQLAKEYDEVKKKVDDAITALKAAEDAQASFKAGVVQAFGTLPDMQAGQSLASYMRQVQMQQAKVEKFKQTLAALRAAGLDDNSYKQFLAEGVDAQRVMEQLLAGGPDAVAQFEQANQGLQASAQGLADMSSAILGYDQAVATAKETLRGLKEGLADQKGLNEIEAQMTKIAKIMMKAIKKELDIKSPSGKARREVGHMVGKGIVRGFEDMHRDVARAGENLASNALDTIQATMVKMGEDLPRQINLDMSPVITPVLDLGQLTKDANAISSLIATKPINAEVSLAQASEIQSAKNADAADGSDDGSDGGSGDILVEFTQEIHSPKHVSPAETYRHTKSGVALLREVLKNT